MGLFLSLCLFAGVLVSNHRVQKLYTLPFPHFDALQVKHTGIQDISFILFGFRGLAADVAWIQLLQYVGGPGIFDEQSPNKFDLVKDLTLRVTRMDPYYTQAYIFGASLLAWIKVINRPQEALDILKEGLEYNPRYWPLHLFAAGIIYKQKNQLEKMFEQLKIAVTQPDCPVVVKAMVARSSADEGKIEDSIAIWRIILADPKAWNYHSKARTEISKLEKRLR